MGVKEAGDRGEQGHLGAAPKATRRVGRTRGVYLPCSTVRTGCRSRGAPARFAAMEPDPDDETRPSAVADAIGGAAVLFRPVAARAWRGRLRSAIEELLSTPEVGRVLDRALAGSLPEEAARSLVRHGVAERVVRELAASGELERMVDRRSRAPRRWCSSTGCWRARRWLTCSSALSRTGGPRRHDGAIRRPCRARRRWRP